MFQVIVICSLLIVQIQCDVNEILNNEWGNANSWSNQYNRFTSGRSNWQPITASSPIASASPQNYISYGVPARPSNYYLPQPQYNFTTPHSTQSTVTQSPLTTTSVPSITTTNPTPSWPHLLGSGHQQPGSSPQQTESWSQQPESWSQQPVSWPQQPVSLPQQPETLQQSESWPQQQSESWSQQQSVSWPQQHPESWSQQQPENWSQKPGLWPQLPVNLPQLGDLSQQLRNSLQQGPWSQYPGVWSQQPGSGSWSKQYGSWSQQPVSWFHQPSSRNLIPDPANYKPISSWLQVNPYNDNQNNKTSQIGNSFVESIVMIPPVPNPMIDLSFVYQPLALSSSIGNVTPMTQAMFLNQINKDTTSETTTVSPTVPQPLPEPLPIMMPPPIASNTNSWVSEQNIPSPLYQGPIFDQQNAVPLMRSPQAAFTLQQIKPTPPLASQPQQPVTITWPQQSSWITEPKSSPFRETTSLQEMVPQISMTIPTTSSDPPQVMQIPLQLVPEVQVMTFKATPVQQSPSNQYLPQVLNRPPFVLQSPQNIVYHWTTNNNGGSNAWSSIYGINKEWIVPTGGNNDWSSTTPGFSGKTPNIGSNVQATDWPSRKRK